MERPPQQHRRNACGRLLAPALGGRLLASGCLSLDEAKLRRRLEWWSGGKDPLRSITPLFHPLSLEWVLGGKMPSWRLKTRRRNFLEFAKNFLGKVGEKASSLSDLNS